MKTWLALTVTTVMVGGVLPGEAASSPAPALTAFVGASLFDGTGSAPIAHATVLIDGDRIRLAGPSQNVVVPSGARVVNCEGRFIVPGLIDAHVHFFQSGGLYARPDIVNLTYVRSYNHEMSSVKASLGNVWRDYLVNGVTSVVDMGGPMWNFEVREQARAEALAPAVAVAGPLISTIARWQLDLGDPPIIRAASADDARTMVKKQLSSKPDLIKIWFVLTPDRTIDEMTGVVRAVVDEAHQAGIRVAVHATEAETARIAVEAGADILVHSVTDARVTPEFVKMLADRNVILIPTLTVMGGYARVLGGPPEATLLERQYGDPRAMATWADYAAIRTAATRESGKRRHDDALNQEPILKHNLLALLRGGVTIAAGTDAGNIGTLHGVSLHAELVAMQDAGMSARDVIVSATRDAARVFARNPDFGTIEPGKRADFLVLGADPMASVANLASIRTIVRAGRVLAPDEIRPPNAVYVVDRQLDAYNARNLDAFVAWYAPDAVIEDLGAGRVVARGHEQIRAVYGPLFAKSPDLNSRVIERVVQSGLVVDHELVTGIRGRPYLHGVATYDVVNGRIARVWMRSE